MIINMLQIHTFQIFYFCSHVAGFTTNIHVKLSYNFHFVIISNNKINLKHLNLKESAHFDTQFYNQC